MAKVRHVAVLVTSHDTPWPGCAVPRHGLPRGHLLQVRAGGLPAAQPVAELQSPPEGALLPSPGGELNIYQIIRSIFPLSVVRASLLPAARRQVYTEHSVRVHPGHHPEGLQEQGLRQDEVQHAALLVVRVVVSTYNICCVLHFIFIHWGCVTTLALVAPSSEGCRGFGWTCKLCHSTCPVTCIYFTRYSFYDKYAHIWLNWLKIYAI